MESLRGIVFSTRTTPTQKAGRLLVGSRANGSQDAAAIPSVPAQSVRIMASGHGQRSEWKPHYRRQWKSAMTTSTTHFSSIRLLCFRPYPKTAIAAASRSEEHKSELQSLMRISYAVFCLKKK